MSDSPWVTEAVAEQEEHIKRQTSCEGRVGMPHRFDTFSPRPGVYIRQCWRCRVTETPEDYTKNGGPGA